MAGAAKEVVVSDPIVLSGERTIVSIDPDEGGAITAYETDLGHERLPWLHAATRDFPASFPLVPFASRIFHGRFEFGGHTVALPGNNPPEPHAIHGHGWQKAWDVTEFSSDMACLRYLHEADAWPWVYEAVQKFEVSGFSLRLSLSVRNLSSTPMPLGLGIHPFFVRTRFCRVRARCTHMWETDDEVMSLKKIPSSPDIPIAQGVEPATRVLDNVFAGWDGHMRIDWPEWGVGLDVKASQPLTHLAIYSPPGMSFFCAEPVSNTADAFNVMSRGEEGHGAVILASGETLSAGIEFSPDLQG